MRFVASDKFKQSQEGVDGVRKEYVSEVKDLGDRKVEFTITTGSVDRDQDVLNPAGWLVGNYLKNPVVLWAHDYKQLPVGKAISLTQTPNGLKSVVEFTPADLNPFGETVHRMVKEGFLNATSVGFRPTKYAFSEERKGGIDYQEQELLEYSIVPVPANAEALRAASAAGIDLVPLRKWAADIMASADAPEDIKTQVKGLVEEPAAPPAAEGLHEMVDKSVDPDGSYFKHGVLGEPNSATRVTKHQTEPYGSVEYADPGYQPDGVKRYPIDTKEHVRAAWSYINMPKNEEKYTAAHLASIKAKIRSAAKKFGIEISEPDKDDKSAQPETKSEAQLFMEALKLFNEELKALRAEIAELKAGQKAPEATPAPEVKQPQNKESKAVTPEVMSDDDKKEIGELVSLMFDEYQLRTRGRLPVNF